MKKVKNVKTKLLWFSNAVLLVAVILLLLNKFGLIRKPTEARSYLDNSQYPAYVSVFELNSRDTDIVFAGDSLTNRGKFEEFFPDAVSLNRGIGGDTAEGLYNRMDEILSHHPGKIFIMIGVNDLMNSVPSEDTLRFFRLSLEKIRNTLPDCRIFVQSVLPVVAKDNSSIASLNRQLSACCEEFKAEYINLYDLFFDETGSVNSDLYSSDGLHINGKGYTLWINAIRTLVSE